MKHGREEEGEGHRKTLNPQTLNLNPFTNHCREQEGEGQREKERPDDAWVRVDGLGFRV